MTVKELKEELDKLGDNKEIMVRCWDNGYYYLQVNGIITPTIVKDKHCILVGEFLWTQYYCGWTKIKNGIMEEL